MILNKNSFRPFNLGVVTLTGEKVGKIWDLIKNYIPKIRVDFYHSYRPVIPKLLLVNVRIEFDVLSGQSGTSVIEQPDIVAGFGEEIADALVSVEQVNRYGAEECRNEEDDALFLSCSRIFRQNVVEGEYITVFRSYFMGIFGVTVEFDQFVLEFIFMI